MKKEDSGFLWVGDELDGEWKKTLVGPAWSRGPAVK